MMNNTPDTVPGNGASTSDDYQQSLKLASGLLDVYIETLDSFVGKAAATIAVTSGRQMAAKNYTAPQDKNCVTAVDALAEGLAVEDVQLQHRSADDKLELTLTNCPISVVCRSNQKPLGGIICSMYHYYLSGMLAELGSSSVRPESFEAGEQQCTLVVNCK